MAKSFKVTGVHITIYNMKTYLRSKADFQLIISLFVEYNECSHKVEWQNRKFGILSRTNFEFLSEIQIIDDIFGD